MTRNSKNAPLCQRMSFRHGKMEVDGPANRVVFLVLTLRILTVIGTAGFVWKLLGR